jgi:hypothetical protein
MIAQANRYLVINGARRAWATKPSFAPIVRQRDPFRVS